LQWGQLQLLIRLIGFERNGQPFPKTPISLAAFCLSIKKPHSPTRWGLNVSPENSRKIACELGRVVRRKREALGLSQEKFAELSDHHRTYIGLFERGERSPNVETLHRVATALGMKGSDLLREAGY
jgi:ribosome-binding protein aMBF1 (putative translation factor)